MADFEDEWNERTGLDRVDVFGTRRQDLDFGFAPPLPTILPEFVVTAPRVVAPPPPPPASPLLPIVSTITRVLAPIVGLLVPLPAGPGRLDEAPTPAVPTPDDPVLPEIEVTAPPRKPPAAPPVPLDPIMPPNWDDIANEPGDFLIEPPGRMPGWLPNPDYTTRSPIELPFLQPFLVPFNDPIDLPTPGRRSKPGDRSTPRISPDPRRDAWPTPDFIGAPIGDFPFTGAPDLRPTTRPDPRPDTRPDPRDRPVPLAPPGGPTLFPTTPEIPVDLSPRAPARPTIAPDNPGVFRDIDLRPTPTSWANPAPDRADPCKCPKTTKKDKKDKKKRKPREVCYEGTYRERSNGTTKKKLREVPCVAAEKKKAAPSESVDSLRRLTDRVFNPTILF